jgi:tetratricopeptide (TPR) repeat protein
MKVFGLILGTLFISASIFAQCNKLSNHPKGVDYAKKLFVYRDAIKAKDFDNKVAITQWRDLYTHCNAGNGNILADGEKIFKYFAAKAEKAKDKKTMKTYLDSVAIVMIQRIECYGEKKRKKTGLPYAGYRYYLLGKHYIVAASKFNPETEEDVMIEYYKKAKDAFKKSIELDGKKAEVKAYEYFGFTSVEIFKAREKTESTVEEMRARYKLLQDVSAENGANAATEEEKAKFLELGETIKGYYKSIERDIFECAYFVNVIKPAFYKNYDNLEYIKNDVRVALVKGGCNEDDEFFMIVKRRYIELIDSFTTKCFPSDVIRRGYNALKAGDETTALEFFIKGVNDASIATDRRFDAAMRAGTLFQRDKKWNDALTYYNKAISLDGNSGKPYMKLGLLYLSANRNCDRFGRQLVANVAIDYFNKAKDYDDTAEEGAEKASEYREYLPTAEQVFQREMKPGSIIIAGCVLKRSTTIRIKK